MKEKVGIGKKIYLPSPNQADKPYKLWKNHELRK